MKTTCLVYVGQSYVPKNRLENAIQEYLKLNDRKLLSGNEIAEFKKAILDQISAFNDKYSRCTPVRASWIKNHENKQPADEILSLGGSLICNLYLYQINN